MNRLRFGASLRAEADVFNQQRFAFGYEHAAPRTPHQA
jgi:hypothetical protein